MSYTVERIKYPDGTIIVRHIHDDGEWWCEWLVAPSEDIALDHVGHAHYGGPGRGFAHAPYRIKHPKKVVFFQRGGLDI